MRWFFKEDLSHNKIKRCPFCGTLCKVERAHDEFRVECSLCGVASRSFSTPYLCVEWWNNRPLGIAIEDDIAGCPFCGGHNIAVDYYSAGCADCLVIGPENSDYEIIVFGGYNNKCLDAALDKWNHHLFSHNRKFARVIMS